jgi:pyruvate/2-oxoglutarate dehydrogenase complex dihydrolipoamide dehydrogenase (E3) component
MIGGGAMGCELSQALARLGSEVTLVERGPRLLAQESPTVSQAAHDALADAGVRILLQSQALECQADVLEPASFTTRVQTPQGQQVLAFDLMILAIGRKPRWQGLGLQSLGIQSLDLDEHLETAVPGIYAAGDVAGGRQMTHLAAHQGWHAALNALQGFWRFRPDRVSMPQVIFMDPEIARVGLTLEQAQQQGLQPEVTRVEWAELDRAIIDERRSGFIELITRAGSDRLLGVTIVGTHAGELLPQFTLAMDNGLGLNKLLANVYAYPTLSEIVRRAAGVHRRQQQPGWLGPWLERWHAWRRG